MVWGRPVAPLRLTLGDVEIQSQGQSDFKALCLVIEPS